MTRSLHIPPILLNYCVGCTGDEGTDADWPFDGRLVVEGLDRELGGARLLGSNGLSFEMDGETLTVELPSTAPDPIASVVAIELE